jgi:pentapeptide repeat protein
MLSTLAGLLLVGWLAPMPWLLDHWPQVLGVGLFLCVFVVPRWFVPARSAASLSAVPDQAARMRLEDDRLKLQNGVRTGLLQAVAAAAVIAAVVVTWQQLEADRRQERQQLALAGQDQLAERFSRAVDQLGIGQLDVRLGGIYGLEGIADQASGEQLGAWSDELAGGQRSAGHRLQVFEILSAYARAHSHQPPTGPVAAPLLQTRQADVQAAATVLGRRTVLADDPPLDLGGSLLGGVRLGGAKLAGADLRGADVRGAILQDADLARVRLQGSLLCGAQLQGADLRGAYLEGARASRTTVWPSGFDWRTAGVDLVASCTP